MNRMIQNEFLTVSIAEDGAELLSIRSCDGIEYLWQGDPTYWSDRAPTLFPFIGRLTQNRYRYKGAEYPMGIHGFAAQSHFATVENDSDRVVLELRENAETQAQYPFHFIFRIIFRLDGRTLSVSYEIQNTDRTVMPFAIGGHPGFRVPLCVGEGFEDYVLEFSEPCRPDRVGFTSDVYLSGHDVPYPLEDGCRIRLRHDLFDEDAVVLKNMGRQIMLRSQKSGHGVAVAYPQMPYLGIWHRPETDAPYVCIEPWSSLPSRQDIIEELSCKSDMIQLDAGEIYKNRWTVTVF